MEFLALSSMDFLGGGGGIFSVPWCAGLACHASFASRNLSEMRSRMCARDMVACVPTISAAVPVSWSGVGGSQNEFNRMIKPGRLTSHYSY
jgi:hypothetical protein